MKTRSAAVLAALGLLLSTAGLMAAPPAKAAAPAGTIASAGPLTKIFVSPDLNCAVDHTGDSHGEFYSDSACGTFVAVGSTVYGPATIPAGPTDPGTGGYKKFTKVSQSAVSGTGTAANPYKLTTVVNAGSTGVKVTQTDTYVVGQESYRTDVAVANTAVSTANVVLYRAGDCFLQNDDKGFGSVDVATGAASCVNAVTNASGQKVPGSRVEQWLPITAGSRYTQGLFSTVWSGITSRQPFGNSCACATYQDNGAGLSWSMTLLPTQTVTRSHLLTFQPVAANPIVTTKTADNAAIAPAAASGYTITFTNPNAAGVTITSVTDDLPAGFTYRSGTSSGMTTTDPVATNNGQHLAWSGAFSVAANGSAALHFGVTASSQAGDYFNRAGGAAAGSATVTPTGDTAKVTVVGAAALTINADRNSAPASPSSVPTSDLPMQRTSPHIQSAPILQLPLLNAPILQLPLLNAPILQLPLLNAPILQLPLLNAPIIQLPLLNAPFGFDSLGDANDLGSSPAVQAGLSHISLAAMPIIDGPDWPTRLAGTPLADKPLQTTTFGDVLALHLAADKLPSLSQLDLSASPLGTLTSLSLFMGDTRLKNIGGSGFGWCAKLEALGHADCGADLGVQASADKGQSASLLSLEIAGVNLDGIDGLKAVLLRDVVFPAAGEAPLPAIQLTSFDLSASSIGGILIKTIPSAGQVVDCGRIDCSATSTKSVYDASRAGALLSTSTIGGLGTAAGGLTLQEAILGTYASDAANAYDVAANQLGVLGYGGTGSSQVAYHVDFTSQFPLAHPTVEVTLPSEFRYVGGSSVVKLDGAVISGISEPAATDEKVTWNLGNVTVAPGHQLTVDLRARPGLRTGPVNASVVVTGDNFSLNAATASPLTVAENFETGDHAANAITIPAGQLQFGHMGHAGDIDYFNVPAPTQPGSHINVFLNCNCDADLVVYHPASAKPHNPMRPARAANEIRSEQDQDLGLAMSGEPLEPLALNDIPILDLPVAGISANRGNASESVQGLTWDAPGGTYLIEVASYLGSMSLDAYSLRVTITPPAGALPAGNPRSFAYNGDASGTVPPVPAFDGVKTLVVADANRLRRAFSAARAQVALDAINRLAGASDLGVKVLFLDGLADVQSAFAQLDARPSDPERSNDVVRAINANVDRLLGANRASLQNLVLVGSDETGAPMGRIPDLTATANERAFTQELAPLAAATGGNNALIGAAASGSILTDDPYCSYSPAPFLGTFLYMPDIACGRLVESPEDIAAVIDTFLAPAQSGDAPGVLHPAKSLVTGYDFMKPLADAIKNTFDSQLTPGQVSSLINESWKRSDIQAAFPGASPVPDVVAALAHYNPSALRPADPSDGLLTTAAFGGATPPDTARRIVMTMGCHSGFSISNFLMANGGAPDWPEAMLGRGAAAFVGNTGFGIGLRSTVAFSERVMADFATNISRMPLGRALVEAKRNYLGGNRPNVVDYKVLAQATYFGLPMFRTAGASDGPPALPAPRPTVLDGPTGLTAVDLSVSNPADNRWQLIDNGEGTYYRLPGGEFTIAPNRPIQPKVALDVNQPGLEVRGTMLTALTSIDDNNFNPVLARTVVGRAASETEVQFGDVIYPTALQSSGDNKVSLTLGQFQSGDAGTVSGLERRFTQVNARAFLVPVGAPHGAPVFHSVTAKKTGSTASFSAVVDDPGGGVVRQVAVLFNDGSSNAWTFRQLAQLADGSWAGGFPVATEHFQYIGQAITDRGDLAITTNKGDNFDFATRPPSSADIHADVEGAGANGWYADGTSVTLSGDPGTTFSVRDNNGPASVWSSGQPIPVRGSGVHTLHYVAAPGGETGDVTVPVDTAVPTISGAPTSAPNNAGWYRGPVTVHFVCTDAESGVATCEPDRTLSTDGTNQSVTGRAVDGVGNAATATVGGINIDTAPPAISGAATTAPNGSGWYRGPVTVHFACTDERSGVATCPADQTISAQGANQSVSGTATDNAGNSTAFTVSGINIDTAAPTISGAPDRAPNANGWYQGPVTITFTCGDAGGSGVTSCPAPQTLSTDGGNQSVSATVADVAGNSTSVTVSGISIDRAPPTIAGVPDRAANSNGWYNAPVTVSFTCGDALAGIASCNAPITVSTDGTNQSVTGSAIDKAGNAATATVSGISIDRTPPTLSATPNDGAWRKGPVTVHFTCADDRSGVATCPADVAVSAEGTTQVSGTTTDKAGNASTLVVPVKIDKTLPTSTFNGSGTIVVLPNGPVAGTAGDNLSGIAAVNITFKNSLSGTSQTKAATVSCAEPKTNCTWTVAGPSLLGFYTATVVATDRAGNLQNPGTVRSVQVIS